MLQTIQHNRKSYYDQLIEASFSKPASSVIRGLAGRSLTDAQEFLSRKTGYEFTRGLTRQVFHRHNVYLTPSGWGRRTSGKGGHQGKIADHIGSDHSEGRESGDTLFRPMTLPQLRTEGELQRQAKAIDETEQHLPEERLSEYVSHSLQKETCQNA